jgi:hypothetical protein
VALPNIETLNKIFDDYLNSLQFQSSFKKWGAGVFNKVRSTFGYANNHYATEDAEKYKIERIKLFKTDFKKADGLQPDEALISWIQCLHILQKEYNLVTDAELVNESKFGLAIRAASAVISQSLQVELQPKMNEFRQILADQLVKLKTSKDAGEEYLEYNILERNRCLAELIKFGDKTSIHDAAEIADFPLFVGHSRPNKKEFTAPASSNAHVSKVAEIYPDIPWSYQPNIKLLYDFRIQNHHFPNNLREWEIWKKEEAERLLAKNTPVETPKAAVAEENKTPQPQIAAAAVSSSAVTQAQIVADSSASSSSAAQPGSGQKDQALPTSPVSDGFFGSTYAMLKKQLPKLEVFDNEEASPEPAPVVAQKPAKATRSNTRKNTVEHLQTEELSRGNFLP